MPRERKEEDPPESGRGRCKWKYTERCKGDEDRMENMIEDIKEWRNFVVAINGRNKIQD